MSDVSSDAAGCLFCALVAGKGEASMVHEDARTATLLDLRPITEGHMLVIPRAHAMGLADLDPEDGAQMFRVGQLAAVSLRGSGLRCEGVNFWLADGEAAGQDVWHVHLHVFPRYPGDGFGMQFPPGFEVRPRSELDTTATALRRAWPSVG